MLIFVIIIFFPIGCDRFIFAYHDRETRRCSLEGLKEKCVKEYIKKMVIVDAFPLCRVDERILFLDSIEMRTSKSFRPIGSKTATSIHIIVLYCLLLALAISCACYAIYFPRTLRTYIAELNHLKQRLHELESSQILISSSIDGDDGAQRRSRHAYRKAKLSGKEQDEENDALFGAIHFKVPVRLRGKRVRERNVGYLLMFVDSQQQ